MAAIQLKPPEEFNFKSPDDWPRWRRRYEQFQVASGLGEKSAAKQVSTFLYCLGEEAESVLASMNATDDDRKDYQAIIAKFDAFFQVRRNVIFERARFNRRNQQPGESSEQYIMVLYSLAANCNYGALEGEMIRDRLIVGIREAALSQRLQMDAALTLEKAKTTIHQQEAVKEQQSILSGSEGPKVDAIRQGTEQGRSCDRRDSQQRRSSRPPKPSGGRWKERQPPTQQCTRCGKEPHTRNQCPAKDAICHRCQKKGHYSTQCRSKNVDESGLETAFLDAATMAEGETAWFAEILVGKGRKGKVTFKLDTGAEVTAVSQETYQMFPNAPPLSTPQRTVCAPSRKPLQVLGECQVVLTRA